MDELKQELTMDEHKIPITELYSRLNSDPTTVSSNFNITVTMDEHKIPITELYSRLNSDPTTVSGSYRRS